MAYIKKRIEKLTNQQVYHLICQTLDGFGMEHPTSERMLSLFRDPIPLPIIKETEELTVWLDRLYIAYSYHHEHEVHYLYMNKQHLIEEQDQAENTIVAESFRQARKQMRKMHRNYYIL